MPWTAAPPACVWWPNITAKATAYSICAASRTLHVKEFPCWELAKQPKTSGFVPKATASPGKSCAMKYHCHALSTGNSATL